MENEHQTRRLGPRRMADVSPDVLARLQAGEIETVNLMEWLAIDMATLARNVAATLSFRPLRDALLRASRSMIGQGVIRRLSSAGSEIARAVPNLSSPEFLAIAKHPSDVVRQWACYAVNDPKLVHGLDDKLSDTLPFAADCNMSVREAAWMAFRPHVIAHLSRAVELLEPVSRATDPSLRRFAIEVTRPRSVWGPHIGQLKREPQIALALLRNTRQDTARYVQIAVGNWLNDASKSRPDWVMSMCADWTRSGDENTAKIVKRGLRTLQSRSRRFSGDVSEEDRAYELTYNVVDGREAC